MSNVIKLITPTKAQAKVIDSIENEDKQIYVLSAGRQSGKTELAKSLLIKWALSNVDATIWYVAPSYKRSKSVYRQIKYQLIDSEVILKSNDAELRIEFVSGSVIHFNSAESKDNLRGETLDYLVVDEFRYIEESIWEEILSAMLFVKGKKALIISTPKGKGNLFHKLYLQGLNAHSNIKSFSFTSFDNPLIKKEQIEFQKNLVSEFIFKSEYLAEFVDSSDSAVFRNVYDCSTTLESVYDGKQYYAGLDTATGKGIDKDYSCLTVVDASNRVVFQRAYQAVDVNDVSAWAAGLLKEWGEPVCFVETNGIGQATYDTLNRMSINNIHPFVMSKNTKHQLVSHTISLFNLKEISLPSDYKELQNELINFEIKMTGKGKYTGYHSYGAPSGMHDDRVMSLMLALWAAYTNEANKIKSNFYFGNGVWV